MKKILTYLFCILLILSFNLFTLSACKDDDYDDDIIDTGNDILTQYFDTSLSSGTTQFTYSIMDSEDFSRIIPLGQLNPPGHTFPTDHIYFVLNGLGQPVYAPTGGKILYIEEPNTYGDRAIRIAVTDTVTYYLGHIFIDESLQVGDIIEAGAQIGTSGNTSCVDFGVLNKNITNAFLNQNYPVTTLYGDKPLSYYAEPLRTELYALVKPPQPSEIPNYVYDGGVTDGNFVYDISGTLCGNWLQEGCMDSNSWYEWEDTLSFCYDVYYPDQIRFASGKYSNAFAIKNSDNPIKPENVTTASGAIAYYLYNANNTIIGVPFAERVGLLMVQMLSDTRIKLEIFEDTTSASRQFTTAALYYTR